MKVSLATVRREVDEALAERPLLVPERYVSVQVLPSLDRYHGFNGRLVLPRAAQTRNSVAAPPCPPLASEVARLAPTALKSLARTSTLHSRPDERETRISPSPMPS